MASQPCKVSFTDTDGIEHSARVQAESLYEAAALAVRAFWQHGCAPGSASRLEVEVAGPSVTHALTVRKLEDWLHGACRSPNERLVKERLKTLLGWVVSRISLSTLVLTAVVIDNLRSGQENRSGSSRVVQAQAAVE